MDEVSGQKAVWWATLIVLALLVAVAVFIRVQFITTYGGGQNYLDWANTHYFGGITPAYVVGASAILSGSTYPFINYPPGYSFFIAGAQLAGADLQQIRLLQAFIDSLAVLGVYWLLRRLSSPRALALAGSGLYAVYAEWVSGSTFLLAEWLEPGLLIWLLVLLVVAKDGTTVWRWAVVGLVIAIGALTRPDLILLIIPAAAWLILTWNCTSQKKMVALVVLVLSFLLPIGGWGLYNRIHHEHWIFTSTGGGAGLWEGLGDIENDYGFILSDAATQRMLQEHGLTFGSVPADHYLKAQYRKAVLQHPFYVLKAIVWRWEQIATKTSIYIFYQAFAGVQRLLVEYSKWIAIWIWLLAMIVSCRNPVALLVLGLPLIYACMSIGLVHYEARYVRYAHLSYLFSAITLLAFVARVLSKHRSTYWLRWAISSGALVASLYTTASYAMYLRDVTHVLELPLMAEQGKLTQLTNLRSMEFRRPVENEITKQPGGELLVHTDRSTYGYQLTDQLQLGPARFLYISFEVNLRRGGFAVGLLGPDQQWLTVKSYATAGDVDGSVGVTVPKQGNVTLVIANNCAKPCRSEFELKDLKVYVEQ